MSQIASQTEGEKAIKELNVAFTAFKEANDKSLEGKASGEELEALKVVIKNTQDTMSEMEAKQLEIAKKLEIERTKAKQLTEVDKDETKRAQIVEFGKRIQSSMKSGEEFATRDLKSFIEFESKAAAQFNSLEDPNGGLAVMPVIDTMIDALAREYSNMRPYCKSITLAKGDTYKAPFLNKTNGALREKDLSSFTTATKTDTLSQIVIPVSRLFSIIPIDKDLEADDMIGFVQALMESAAEDFAVTEGEELVNGDGKSEWSGIKNTTDGTAYNEIERYTTAASAGAGAITYEDLVNLQGLLKTAHKRNGAFYMPREIMTIVRLLRSDSGAGAGTGYPLWQPSLVLGQPSTLLGDAVRELAELDTSETVAGNIPIAYGDFRGYGIVDRQGIEIQRNPYTSYPAVLMQICKRSGGGLVNGEKIKLLKMKA